MHNKLANIGWLRAQHKSSREHEAVAGAGGCRVALHIPLMQTMQILDIGRRHMGKGVLPHSAFAVV
jgi:hypothetical protein